MNALYVLVTCLITLVTAIRVDWNTNHGPIIPPTPRTTVRPQPPYREPAPVWEDQSRDLPNPYPYVYILPPPSRQRPATNNYLTAANYNAESYNARPNNYGQLVPPAAVTGYYQQGNTNTVAALSPSYVPNVGIQYTAVVPPAGAAEKSTFAKSTGRNNLSPGYYVGGGGGNGGNDKPQGKYNAKTKKYKAYEKSKYQPINYYPMSDLTLPNEQQYVPEFNSEQLLRTQQLPLSQAPQTFHASNDATHTTASTYKQQDVKNYQTQAKLHGIKSNAHKFTDKLPKKHYDAKLNTAATTTSPSSFASTQSSLSPIAPTSTTPKQYAPQSANSIFS